MRLLHIIFHNFWPKLISLFLAVATWFYVFDLVNSESYSPKKQKAEDIFANYNFIVKEVPVKPTYTGKSPNGYKVVFNDVKVEPSRISILGPEKIIENVAELRTERINLGEYTRSTVLRLGIRSDIRSLKMKEKDVEVYLPIVKVKEDRSALPPMEGAEGDGE